jgi:cob(I)alamin adenosyltransferase
MKIYTKTGDQGLTGLFDGTRVSKSDARVDAYGEVDEVNAWLGHARAGGVDQEIGAMIDHLQKDLFAVGAMMADPGHHIATRVKKALLDEKDVARLEGWIDALEASIAPLRKFILPGGTPAGASLHVARTVCRRAERRMIALGPDAIDSNVLVYVNRLSDLLFVMARAVNARAGVPEIEW